jgi:hypothetical protein
VSRARSIGSVGCLAIAGNPVALADMLVGPVTARERDGGETARLARDTGSPSWRRTRGLGRLIAAWRGEEEPLP